MSLFLLILPDFLTMALGWCLLHRFRLPAELFRHAEKLVYFILFPAALFHATTQRPIVLADAYLLAAAAAALAAGGVAMAWLAKPVLRPDPIDFASVNQCAYRFNTYIALSLSANLGGPAGAAVMAIAVAVSVPLVNIAAVQALAQQRHGGLWRSLISNPLIIGAAAGLAWNFTGLTMPTPVATSIERLGQAALGVGLLCAGATLSLQGVRRAAPLIGWITVVRLIAMPALAWGLGLAFGLPPMERAMLLLFGTLPTASTAYVLAGQMGGNPRVVVVTTSITTVLSVLTISLWMGWASPLLALARAS